MGASGSSKKIIHNSEYIHALLISFTKIKEFNEYFKYQKDKQNLSKIFYSLIDSNLLDGIVLEFNKYTKKFYPNEMQELNINQILDFILTQLHDENNKLKGENINNNNNNLNIDNTNEIELYNNFKKYYLINESIIQDLFYREDEFISICSTCKTKLYKFTIEKTLHFDMIKYFNENNLQLIDLITTKQEKHKKNLLCNHCNIITNHLCITNFKKLPEIFIISFDNINYKKITDYYLNMEIANEKYILIGIIINKDENNEDVNNYNLLYKDKNTINTWFIYATNKKEKRNIKNIKTICQNPLVLFYQKKITLVKIYLNKIYTQLNFLFKGILSLEEKINKHIGNINNFEKYYLVNKLWFLKISKILESTDIYNNNTILFESFNDINNIHTLNNDQLNNLYEIIIKERIKEISDIIFPEFEINKESNITYPKDFVLINEKDLNIFLDEINIEIKNKEKMLYEIIFGENYTFIKDNKENNVYFVTYNLMFFFNVEKIFILNDKKYFEREINFYIKNKGLEAYYEERNLDIDLNVQNIIDKEGDNIGSLINVVMNKTMINLNKFVFNRNLKE